MRSLASRRASCTAGQSRLRRDFPAGAALRVTAESADGAAETDPEIRAGVASWYDIPLRPRP